MRIISFSLFGDNPMYRNGMRRNFELAPQIYPGWTIKVYDAPINGIPDGHFWRFLAADLAEAEYVIFRDADSRLNTKEKAAVEAWIASGQKAHVMQDHPDQSRYPIPAGMWGVKGGFLKMRELLQGWPYTLVYGDDELFLTQRVWPLIRDHHLRHGTHGQPWPAHAPILGFVGQRYDALDRPIHQ